MFIAITAFQQIPELEMRLGENDDIGTEESETCFGCGDCSVYCSIENEYTISASSYLKEEGLNSYEPNNIDDYSLKKAWIEGAKGYGKGEWIEYEFDKTDFSKSDVELNGLYLFNGYRKSINSWKENSRIQKLKMIVNGKEFAILKLKDSYKIQSTDFSTLKLSEIKTIRFEIIESYKGDKYPDVALSELKFKGVHHH